MSVVPNLTPLKVLFLYFALIKDVKMRFTADVSFNKIKNKLKN